MLKKIFCITFLFCFVFLRPPQKAGAYCQMTTEQGITDGNANCTEEGIPLLWRRPCITYSVDFRGSSQRDIRGNNRLELPEIRQALRNAFSTWEQLRCEDDENEENNERESVGFEIRESEELAQCKRAEFNTKGPNVNTVAFVQDWKDMGYNPRARAVTSVWYSTESGEIFDADILINEESGGNFTICPALGCLAGTVDLENVLTHEVGHFFGLAHSEIEEATMHFFDQNGDTSKRSLHPDDIEGFCSIYEEDPFERSCNFEPHEGFGLDCENPIPNQASNDGCSCDLTQSTSTTFPWFVLAFLGSGIICLRRKTS
jgi:hypothetical protein